MDYIELQGTPLVPRGFLVHSDKRLTANSGKRARDTDDEPTDLDFAQKPTTTSQPTAAVTSFIDHLILRRTTRLNDELGVTYELPAHDSPNVSNNANEQKGVVALRHTIEFGDVDKHAAQQRDKQMLFGDAVETRGVATGGEGSVEDTGEATSSMAIVPVDPSVLRRQAEAAQAASKVAGGRKSNATKTNSGVDEEAGNKAAAEFKPWTLCKVLLGHVGWVRCTAVDPSNAWFATSGADAVVKIWSLATGELKLTLTGHTDCVRGIAISKVAPYMYTCAEDNTVRGWDLEQNKVTRYFHGHLGAVNTVTTHPSIENIVFSGGIDRTVRVWDVRSRKEVHIFQGHDQAVNCLLSQSAEPQLISGSTDCTIRLWDIVGGRSRVTLTHHRKPIKALVSTADYPGGEFTFASVASDAMKKFRFPNGEYMGNFGGITTGPAAANKSDKQLEREQIKGRTWTCADITPDGIMFAGSEDGYMHFSDYKSCSLMQAGKNKPLKGSLPSECGVLGCAFDHSGSRLVTAHADKTVKMWKPKTE